MFATVFTRATLGMHAPVISVEVDISPGLPSITIIGLPEAALRESKDRVRSALTNSGYEFPAGRITINLAPAELPKDGGRFDLAIALAILAASGQANASSLELFEFFGELSLDGHLRSVSGILPAVLQATKERHVTVVPVSNLKEARLVPGAKIVGVNHIREICDQLADRGFQIPSPMKKDLIARKRENGGADLAEVRGLIRARRALEIVAAGEHNMLLTGTPGVGKTMLASRLPGILPPMTQEEAIETAAVTSLSPNGFQFAQWAHRPFRSPHHTTSTVALVGGGSYPMPGEVSLAHNGVLLLDELPEFEREAVEALREPLETAVVSIARAAYRVQFPARFQLIATMNGCPCGYVGDARGRCQCTERDIARYVGRISGPFLDRIDVCLVVRQERGAGISEGSAAVSERVARARARQIERQSVPNARLAGALMSRYCEASADARSVLTSASTRLDLSHRAKHRVMKVARTIADLEGTDSVTADHVSEALLLHSSGVSTMKRLGMP